MGEHHQLVMLAHWGNRSGVVELFPTVTSPFAQMSQYLHEDLLMIEFSLCTMVVFPANKQLLIHRDLAIRDSLTVRTCKLLYSLLSFATRGYTRRQNCICHQWIHAQARTLKRTSEYGLDGFCKPTTRLGLSAGIYNLPVYVGGVSCYLPVHVGVEACRC
jgi:hypothetical protein